MAYTWPIRQNGWSDYAVQAPRRGKIDKPEPMNGYQIAEFAKEYASLVFHYCLAVFSRIRATGM